MTTDTVVRKQLDLEIKDAAQGTISAVFSTFNVIDADGDVVKPGAIPDGAEVPIVVAHNWSSLPVGKGVIRVSRKNAILDGQFFLETQAGRDAFLTVKAMGKAQQYSWGFKVTESEYGQFEGKDVRFITGTEPMEVSPVIAGSNPITGTLSIKATWDTAYINSLPDSAFAVVDENGRHLPHHDKSGAVDMPHLRNAMSREPQTNMSDANHMKAHAHLMRHAKAMGMDTGQSEFPDAHFAAPAGDGLKGEPREPSVQVDGWKQDAELRLAKARMEYRER